MAGVELRLRLCFRSHKGRVTRAGAWHLEAVRGSGAKSKFEWNLDLNGVNFNFPLKLVVVDGRLNGDMQPRRS